MLSRRLVCEVIGNPQSQTSLRMDSQTPHYKLEIVQKFRTLVLIQYSLILYLEQEATVYFLRAYNVESVSPFAD